MYAGWLKRELERTHQTQAALAAALGIDATKMSKALNGSRRLQPQELDRAASFFGVPLPSLFPRATALVSSFDPDLPDTQGLGLDVPAAADDGHFPADAIRELTAIGGLGAGGSIAVTYVRGEAEIVARDEVKDDYWRFPSDFVRGALGSEPAHMIAIECQGDSMLPTLSPGDRVWVNTRHRRPSPDGLYAIRDALDSVIVKRLELIDERPPRVRVISDNPQHSSRETSLGDLAIIGKVVCGLRLF